MRKLRRTWTNWKPCWPISRECLKIGCARNCDRRARIRKGRGEYSMTDFTERIRNLTPGQQELLRHRMEEKESKERREPQKTKAEEISAAPRSASETPAKAMPQAQQRRRIDFSLFFFSANGTVSEEDR